MMSNTAVFLLLLLGGAAALPHQRSTKCDARQFEYDSVACACSAARCDLPPGEPSGGLASGQVLRLVSSRDGLRLDATLDTLLSDDDDNNNNESNSGSSGASAVLVRAATAARQSVLGFGGAVTDSAALNILSLSRGARRQLLDQLFGRDGSRYNVVRVPVGGTDFSTHNYTYDDGAVDPALRNFALAKEDLDWKIPVLHEIAARVGPSLRLFGSAWSAPDWMVSWDEGLKNHLNPEYDQQWADYYVKFLDSYAREGLHFWGLTTQNEPSDGVDYGYTINHMGWTPERASEWIRNNLGPTLHANGYGDLKVIIHDDQRSMLPEWPSRTLNDSLTNSYVSGIAVHWYFDKTTSPDLLTETHDLFPDKFLLYTEACDGAFMSPGPSVQLGNWTRAEDYAQDIIDAINHWATGWVDWNLALNTSGGPSWAGNEVDSAIIVNATADEFLKQPIHYALTHFSRYVPPNSRHVPVTIDGDHVMATAFVTPEDRFVVVLLNRNSSVQDVKITFEDLPGKSYKDTLPEHSITTLIIKQN